MVFQSYALFPHLRVAENIVFGLRARRVPAAERQRRLAEAADMLGLAPLLHRRPASSPAASSSAWRSAAPWWRRRRSA